MTIALEPLARLERDIKKASSTLGRDEARFLVDAFYSVQDFRIQTANQVRSILKSETEEPHATLQFFLDQFAAMEKQIHSSLDTYSNGEPLGRWTREHVGVGPVIAAGLLAHIDIAKAPYASSIHRFAGLLPGQRKQKGVKRDWNADLKVLAWKLGDSFVKNKGREKCYYGHIYSNRKQFEIIRDQSLVTVPRAGWYEVEAPVIVFRDGKTFQQRQMVNLEAIEIDGKFYVGGHARDAAKTLNEKNIKDKDTRAKYLSGHLPDGHLDMRARRYAVKRFLSAYFEQAFWYANGTEPPKPWVHEYGGHEHKEDNPFVPFDKRKIQE